MKKLLHVIYNYNFKNLNLKKVSILIVVLCLNFAYFDLTQDTASGLYRLLTAELENPEGIFGLGFIHKNNYVYFIYAILIILPIYIGVHAYISFRGSIKKHGKERFMQVFLPHFLTNVVEISLSFVLFYAIGYAFYFYSGEFTTLNDLMGRINESIEGPINQYIPTLIDAPYFLAIVLAILAADLSAYLMHGLGHWSRFVWYVFHRPHHTSEILHPMGIGPFFVFPVFLKVPSFVISLVCSKLVHHEALFFETLVIGFISVLCEKFSHSEALYKFAYNNKIVRFLTSFYGHGVYHYMHHSAVEGEEIVNLSGNLFNFWDKVFGTYKSPRKEPPPTGLTNQPEIILNPLAINLSGMRTIWYELKHNDYKHWFKILFGSVYYHPEHTKDFLILGYSHDKI